MLVTGSNTVVVLELETPAPDLVAATVDTPSFHASPNCDPAGKLAPGTGVVMYSEDAAYVSAQQWSWSTTGQIQLASNASLCVAVGPSKDPSTGQLALALALCSDSHAVAFTYHATSQEVSTSSGCVDITGHASQDSAPLEVYGCNGGLNQMFTYKVNACIIVVGTYIL